MGLETGKMFHLPSVRQWADDLVRKIKDQQTEHHDSLLPTIPVPLSDESTVVLADNHGASSTDNVDGCNLLPKSVELPMPTADQVALIRARIAAANRTLNRYLVDHKLTRWLEEMIWLATYYSDYPTHRGNVDVETIENRTRIGIRLMRLKTLGKPAASGLTVPTPNERIATMTVLGILPRGAFDVMEESTVDDVAKDLASAASPDEKNPGVRYAGTLALAHLAATFRERDGMVSTATLTVVRTMESLRRHKTFQETPMIPLIEHYSRLIEHDRKLAYIERGEQVLKRLKQYGATQRVRTTATAALDKLQSFITTRIKDNNGEGSGSSTPPSGLSSGGLSGGTSMATKGQGFTPTWRGLNRFYPRFRTRILRGA